MVLTLVLFEGRLDVDEPSRRWRSSPFSVSRWWCFRGRLLSSLALLDPVPFLTRTKAPDSVFRTFSPSMVITRFLRVTGLGGDGFCCWLLLVLYSGLGGSLLSPTDLVERRRLSPPVRPECVRRGVGASTIIASADA